MAYGSIRVCEGNVAVVNPFPKFNNILGYRGSKVYYLPGEHNGIERSIQITDDDLSKGLLFLGSAGTGKTNTMLALASQVLEKLDKEDIVIFFDLKGDYRRIFRDSSDFVLTATNDHYVWNLFDELTPYLNDKYMLDMRIKELCHYLYKGRESEEPYFTNAAREVTECIIKYFLYSAMEKNNCTGLNNKEFVKLVRGIGYDYADTYDLIRDLLQTYDEFKAALSYIPPREIGDRSAFGVIGEITNMVNDVFAGAFGASDFNDGTYISAAKFAHREGAQVIYLAYNMAINASQTYVFRYFVDNVIADCCDYFFLEESDTYLANRRPVERKKLNKNGKVYIFLDEFARLPKLEYLSLALGQMRSLGVCIIGGLQSVEQIKAVYNEHEANSILSGFQSVIAYNCDSYSIRYIQSLTGEAKVQERFQRAGGAIDYTPPIRRNCVEDSDIIELRPGEAIAKLVGHRPFKFRFALNGIRGD